jgi:glycosyltransferase involved in cell wall biosynthesis
MVALFSKFPFQVGYFYNSGALKYFNWVVENSKPNSIFTQLIRMSEYTRRIKNIPIYLDYMDSFSKGMERRKNKSKGIQQKIFALEEKKLRWYETLVHSYYQKTFIISEQDLLTFDEKLQNQITILPNGVDDIFFTKDTSKSKNYDLIFTGNMSYPPNVDAVIYVAKKILPILWKTHPDINFLIAGAQPSASVKALENDKIKVSGWLDDIRDAYYKGKIFLAPLQIGTGLQNKLLEAMSMEIPCITSGLANNALGAKHEDSILIAQNPDEYANYVLELLNNKDLYQKLAANSRVFVQQNYNWEAITQQFINSIEQK